MRLNRRWRARVVMAVLYRELLEVYPPPGLRPFPSWMPPPEDMF
jgi:hypothetical protein